MMPASRMRAPRNALLPAILAGLLFAAGAQAQDYAGTAPIDRIAAVVNEDVILRSELDRAVANIRAQYAGKEAQLPPAEVLVSAVVFWVIWIGFFLSGVDVLGFPALEGVVHEFVLYTGREATRADAIAFLEDTGGFIGNGDDEPWEAQGIGGASIAQGGDGTRERRYLETLELGIRQTIRQAQYLWRRHTPRLMIASFTESRV